MRSTLTRSPVVRRVQFAVALVLCLSPIAIAQQRGPQPTPADTDNVKHFRMQSDLLTKFWGRPMFIEAGVVLPHGYSDESRPPVCYNIHGFGGSHRVAWRVGTSLETKMATSDYPRMLYVYMMAQFPMGHHEFADSVNNGPWGAAFTTEFIPALEKKFHAYGGPEGRFVMGHSSGGWSSCWLQVTYPDLFGGTWSSSPDPVDLRDFTGVNVYEADNFYYKPNGEEVHFIRNGDVWRSSIRKYTTDEIARQEFGGQMYSFDAVFSPRGRDGRPMPMFDRQTGKIDHTVSEAWKPYDISLKLRTEWPTLGPKLQGKLHFYCGTKDTYGLNYSLALLETELRKLDSDAQFLWIEGRGHGISAPDPVLWPKGMEDRMHRDMWKTFESKAKPAAPAASPAKAAAVVPMPVPAAR